MICDQEPLTRSCGSVQEHLEPAKTRSEVTEGPLSDAGGSSSQRAAASDTASLAQQRSKWMRQLSAAPNLQCGKDQMFPLTLELVRKISDGEAVDLDARPVLSNGESSRTWREYSSALRPMGLTQTQKGALHLTTDGAELLADGSRSRLGSLMADRIRLFAEALGLLVREPLTVEEVNSELVESYSLDWKTVGNTRLRMTWLEVLGLSNGLETGSRARLLKGVGFSLPGKLSLPQLWRFRAQARRLTSLKHRVRLLHSSIGYR